MYTTYLCVTVGQFRSVPCWNTHRLRKRNNCLNGAADRVSIQWKTKKMHFQVLTQTHTHSPTDKWITHSPQTRRRCCSPPQTLKSPLSLHHHFLPVKIHIQSYLMYLKVITYLLQKNPKLSLTSSRWALICRSISSGLLNCFPRPLWPFFPARQFLSCQ